MMGCAMAAGDSCMAALLLVMFMGYFRPNEVVTLPGKRLLAPGVDDA